MLIARTKLPDRNLDRGLIQTRDVQVAYATYGALFTPSGAMSYIHGLLDWIAQNAWDAETYFWDMAAVQFRRLGAVDPALETTCSTIISSSQNAIEEVIHTLSDLCAKTYTYTFSFDAHKTQYAPHLDDITAMVKEQTTLLNKLSENPMYDEIYRRYCGFCGPWGLKVDPDYTNRDTSDPLVDALDDIWDQACELLEELGGNFPPVYTLQYPLYKGSIVVPDAYKVLTDTDDNTSIAFLKDDEYIIAPATPDNAFRTICPGDVLLDENETSDQEEDIFRGQFGYDWTSSYSIISHTVYALAVQSDGKVLVGGSFSDKLVRLNKDGSQDTTFTPPTLDSAVYALAVQSDEKIWVGGDFTGKLFRLNTDGSLDASFSATCLLCESILIQDNGKVLVGGVSSLAKKIWRYDTDDTVDATFTTSFPAGNVLTMTVLTNGKILAGGSFTGYMARLNADGSTDATFSPSLDDKVWRIAVQSDGQIVIGGEFTGYLKRLNATDGSNDATFSPSLDGKVTAMKMLADGRFVIGGAFTGYLKRLNANGSEDTTFASTLNSNVNRIEMLTYGEMIIGGSFTGRYKRLANDGSEMPTVTAGTAVAGTVFGDGIRLRKIKGTV